jgi:tetratricopeptide (TPR) repeat protein
VIANRSAYQSFLRGKHELAKASLDALSSAESHFQRAILEDANLAGAWAGLAEISSIRGLFLNQSRAAMIEESLRCARRALALDPREPDALVVIGRMQALEEFDVQGALATFTQILDTHGEHGRARLLRALYCLAARGDLEAAEGEVESVLEIDPLRLEAQFALGQVLYFQRRYDQAIRIFGTLIELAPTFAHAYFAIAMACLASGRIAELSSAHELQMQHIPYPLVDEWGEALRLHFSGASQEALAVLDRMEAAGASAPTVVADACVRLGRLDRAVEWLEQAWDERNFRMLHLAVDPAFDALRHKESFQRLVSRLRV